MLCSHNFKVSKSRKYFGVGLILLFEPEDRLSSHYIDIWGLKESKELTVFDTHKIIYFRL